MDALPSMLFALGLAALGCSGDVSGSDGAAGKDGGTGGAAGKDGGTADADGAAGDADVSGPFTDLPASCFSSYAGFINKCNPITNEPCKKIAGAACDVGQYGFECFPSGNTVAEGQPCNNTGAFCQGTLGCKQLDPMTGAGKCEKYCCADSDCVAKKCVAINADKVGTFGYCE